MLVTINNVHVQYGKQVALHIEEPIIFNEGERIGIIGSNGAGKSTLVKTILGLTSYKGSIKTQLQPEEMAVHLQQNNYVNTMSVMHIMETLLNTKIKKNKKLQELIAFFEFEGCLKKKFSALSGGQKQRLTIIMVMIQEAPLTFFDEVTSGLDFETRQKLMEKLVQWYEDKNTTICVVSHYYEELEQLVDKLLILEKGELVAFGNKEELFHTYCGNAIITVDHNERNELLTANYQKLKSPNHLIAISCKNKEIEEEITSLLIHNNVNFKRSNNDIEIMSINAKERFFERGEEYHEGKGV